MGSKQKGKENKKIIIIITGFWIVILVDFLLFLVTDLDILFYFYVKDLLKCQLARRCRSYVGMGGFGKKVNEHELSLGYSIFYFSFIIIIIILIRIFHFWLIKVRYIFLFFRMKPGNLLNKISQCRLKVHKKDVEEHPPSTPSNH